MVRINEFTGVDAGLGRITAVALDRVEIELAVVVVTGLRASSRGANRRRC